MNVTVWVTTGPCLYVCVCLFHIVSHAGADDNHDQVHQNKAHPTVFDNGCDTGDPQNKFSEASSINIIVGSIEKVWRQSGDFIIFGTT